MKPLWLLERDTFHENLERLQQAIADQGMQYKVCTYIPFGGGLEFEKPTTIAVIPEGGCIYNRLPMFAYGSLQMVKRCQDTNLSVVSFCNLPQFKCSFYYPRIGSFLLQQEYDFIPFGQLTRRQDWILTHIGRQGQVFIRPDDGFKTFTGQLVSAETWDKDIELLGFYDVPPECMCVVAEPQNIVAEYRFVIGADYPEDENPQRIITGSCYKANGKLLDVPTSVIDDEILRYVELVLEAINTTYRPDPFWTLDICTTRDGKYHVLEVGSMSCTGLYGCDLNAVVSAISAYLEAEWKEFGPKPIVQPTFEEILERFRSGDLKVDDWNWCVSHDTYYDKEKPYVAYIMGCGAEQCLASKRGFASEEEVKALYDSLGVTKRIIWI